MKRTMHRLALRDLAARRFQFAALALIIALGIAIYVCLTVAFGNIGRSYDRTYSETHMADFTVRVDSAPASVIEQVRALPNVRRATARLVLDTGAVAPGAHLVQARLIGLPTNRHPAVNDVIVESGRYLRAGDGAVTLPVQAFADYYHLKPGETVEVHTPKGLTPLTVAGTVASPEYLILAASKQDLLASADRFGVLFVPEEELGQLFGMAGRINDVDVVVQKSAARAATIEAVTNLLAPYGVRSTTRSEDQPSKAATQFDLNSSKQFAVLLPALILGVAALAIYIAMSRVVRAQRMLIGVFRALGYGTREIMTHYLLIAALTASAGAAAGVVLGYGLSYVLTDAYTSALKIPLVTHAFQPWPIVTSALVAVAVVLLAAAMPARAAVRLLPAPAMRPAPESARARTAVLPIERILWLGRRPPMLLRLSLRNAWRSPARTFYTIAAVSLALLLLLVGFSTFDSMSFTMNEQFAAVDRWDVSALFSAVQPGRMLEPIRSISGIKDVEPVYVSASQVTGNGHVASIELDALADGQRLHGFNLRSGRDANTLLRQGGVILSSGVASELHASAGDRVQIAVGDKTATLAVAGVSDEALGGRAYVSMNTKDQVLGLPAGFNAILATTSGPQTAHVEEALYSLPNVAGVQLKSQMRNDWESVMGLFNVMIWFVVAFCLVMAAAITFNTMTVNVLDREREIGTLRTMGASPHYIAATLAIESVFLTVLAVAPGLIAGTFASSALMGSFSSEFFSIFFHVRQVTYGVIVVLVIAAAVLSTLPSIRRCGRLDLTDATKTLT